MKITTDHVKFVSYPSTEWIVDFETGRLGEMKTSLQAVKQDIQFALSTERYKYPIMGSNFGASFEDLVGTDYEYIQSELSRRITDALSIDDRVLEVTEFEFTRGDSDSINVSCVVKTTLGSVDINLMVQS